MVVSHHSLRQTLATISHHVLPTARVPMVPCHDLNLTASINDLDSNRLHTGMDLEPFTSLPHSTANQFPSDVGALHAKPIPPSNEYTTLDL
ncbi:hypothetical protein CORC01_12517 [Colletotrichum orchidophilum]|uniref:Uncharacterized protein n=1 Tax=Colletotrichum orchidophilum TaxID=1209926 RepID=A0A1G4AT01_9PEZI|nr:uncharacterized protein CORC01_12517 [Colletotrichum orchidophilum]OHE92172.1 hypothetical protein CORC01_12517 [Colletotrichum orchidophilum]